MRNRNSNSLRQKRFGQYFSGSKVADLLVSLIPESQSIHTIIDPMAGIGDMLSAVQRAGITVEKLIGIELDHTVIEECQVNVPDAQIICEDAFSSKAKILPGGWDLVITNPPYVRYQLQTEDENCVMPNGSEIKKNLLEAISSMVHLSPSEKEFFSDLAQGYSGLADMAVPSWILCAAMVKQNGYLAIVVPDTWLSRDYASPIQFMLLKCFDVITVARDIGAVWFDNALVRTCLIVAKRDSIVSLADGKEKKTYNLNLGPDLVGKESLVDNMIFGSSLGMCALKNLLLLHSEIQTNEFSAYLMQTYTLFPNLFKSNTLAKWISNDDFIELSDAEKLPLELQVLDYDFSSNEFTTIEKMGMQCGQGLRTGANDFFYGTVCDETAEEMEIDTKAWHGRRFKVPKHYLVKTLQNRGEIKGLYVDPQKLKTALLYLQRDIRESDKKFLNSEYGHGFKIMTSELAEYIDAAEKYVSPKGKKFPELSAVKPNVKKDMCGYFRFWYMLPKLTDRHLPNLCITRVCSKSVECLYVPQLNECPIAVDANFVTLWSNDEKIKMAILALLNSLWFKCNMELTCTVMGGGALKIEANHLRNILFPKYTSEQITLLTSCGVTICKNGVIDSVLQQEIDLATLAPFENADKDRLLNELKKLQQSKLKERGAAYD